MASDFTLEQKGKKQSASFYYTLKFNDQIIFNNIFEFSGMENANIVTENDNSLKINCINSLDGHVKANIDIIVSDPSLNDSSLTCTLSRFSKIVDPISALSRAQCVNGKYDGFLSFSKECFFNVTSANEVSLGGSFIPIDITDNISIFTIIINLNKGW